MLRFLNLTARGLGTACGIALALLWLIAIWRPAGEGLALTGVSFVVALGLAFVALLGAIAAWRGHGAVLAFVFLVSFFPVGAFLLPTGHWLRAIGWLDIGLLVAAVAIWLTARLLAPRAAPLGGSDAGA